MNRGTRIWWALAAAIAVTPAVAQDQDDSPLEEVVVTAQFREENLQDTPIAITAVNAAMLEQRSQYSIYEVAAQAPNVTLTPGGIERGSSMIAFIRGVGQTDFNYAVEPGVGIYVDDVYYATLTGSLLDLLDLDRVEISRGPQGTLAGRNSIGGAIKLYSQMPDADGGGSLQATYGDYDRVDIRGSGGFTLVPDKLFARIAGASRSRDGYVKRLDYRCVHPTSIIPTYSTGHVESCEMGTEGGISYTAGRASLRWVASDNLNLTFTGDIVNDSSEPPPTVLRQVNEAVNNPNVAGPPGTVVNGIVIGGVAQGTFFDADGDLNTTGDREYYSNAFVTHGQFRGDSAINDPYVTYTTYLDPDRPLPTRPFSPVAVPPINEIDHWGLSATIDWALGEDFSIKSITAYREYEADWAQDADASPLNSQMLLQHLEHDQFSQELRLNGSFGDAIDFTVGGFYFEQDGTLEANVNLYYAQLNFIHGPDPTPSDSQAAFAHATWHITDRLNLSAGVRYTEDHKEYTYFRRNPDGTLPTACPGPPPIGQIQYPPNCALFDGFSGQPLFDITAEFDSESTDYRAALDYHFTDDFMVYGQVATAYKGGGVNPRPFFIIQIETFEPEEMTTYEVGFKTTLFDNRMRLNVAAFENDYQDIQLEQFACEVPFLPPPAVSGPCLQPGNAGSATVRGAELETEIRVAGGFSFDASVSYLDFEYDEINPTTGVTLDMITPYTPEMKWATGLQYEFGRGSTWGSLIARADIIYQDEIFTEGLNAPSNLIEDYTLVNGRVTWRSETEDWEAALEVSNVTDEVYFLSLFRDQFGTSGTVAGAIGPPRMWAFTLKRSF